MRYILTIIIFFSVLLNALSLKDIKDMPKSRERDFYIWRFIENKNTTKQEAKEAIKLRLNSNYILKKAYLKKTGLKLTRKKSSNSNNALKKKYQDLIKELKSSSNFYNNWLKLSDIDKLRVFILSKKEDRVLLNRTLNRDLYNSLTKYKQINRFIKSAKKAGLKNLLKTLYGTKPVKGNKINYNNLMKIGFINLKNGNKKAKYFFYDAIYKAKDRFNADRAIFWLYMTTKEKKYLTKLSKSYDFNIYKLIALDFLNKPYPMPAKEVKLDNKEPIIDITSPIEWAKLKSKIFSKKIDLNKLAQKYATNKSAGYYYYIKSRASRDTKQYFPIIYQEYMKEYSIDRKAFILALARQESRFIPASVSRSFAVGLMQFMPFLVKHIAKERKESIKLEDMFKPDLSIKFANTHLNYLDRWLKNPLFVAYAYNAGIGYTRRMLRKANMFKEGKYEPYLSIELLNNDQANTYGKKVLANYVIYKMLLNKPTKITTILNQLTKPTLTDNFR